ncbi:MAG: hypothetical protein CTY12_01015 [Methylotenera sp.]|nr:MAG: hypothetical protein CTY12_01015 [Methylotenera sp.]
MKLTVIASVVLALLIGACTPEAATETGQIVSVPELKKDAVIRHKIWAWCQENPGERHGMPNCLNAAHAGY